MLAKRRQSLILFRSFFPPAVALEDDGLPTSLEKPAFVYPAPLHPCSTRNDWPSPSTRGAAVVLGSSRYSRPASRFSSSELRDTVKSLAVFHGSDFPVISNWVFEHDGPVTYRECLLEHDKTDRRSNEATLRHPGVFERNPPRAKSGARVYDTLRLYSIIDAEELAALAPASAQMLGDCDGMSASIWSRAAPVGVLRLPLSRTLRSLSSELLSGGAKLK